MAPMPVINVANNVALHNWISDATTRLIPSASCATHSESMESIHAQGACWATQPQVLCHQMILASVGTAQSLVRLCISALEALEHQCISASAAKRAKHRGFSSDQLLVPHRCENNHVSRRWADMCNHCCHRNCCIVHFGLGTHQCALVRSALSEATWEPDLSGCGSLPPCCVPLSHWCGSPVQEKLQVCQCATPK